MREQPKPSALASLTARLREQIAPSIPSRRFRGPVGWMLDRQLVTSLREIFLYDSFGGQIDPRNWMAAREVDRSQKFEGDEYWFDYLSDSGDGMSATYSIAYLAQSDLFVPPNARAGDAVGFAANSEPSRRLPRGDFLFVGGDTAYHVADFETLTERFQTPFNFAYRDLDDQQKLTAPKRRPILGIPGNHDYYDFLDGFNRQFRRPYDPEPQFDDGDDPDAPQLVLEGFERKQWASFVSIEMPFNWRFWGLDAQGGKMDRRQRNYFRSMREDPKKPTEKLIVATPEPILKFGQRADPDGEIAKTFAAIGLPRPFLGTNDPEDQIPLGGCRLDLAGDVHHYARYGGSEPFASNTESDAEKPASYASVVSGLGGAFLHPSSTDVGEISSLAKYPSPRTSLHEVLSRLLRPWTILRGGRLWLIGLLITGFLFTATASSESLRSVFRPALRSIGLDLPNLVPFEKVSETHDPIVQALSALRTSLEIDRKVPLSQQAAATHAPDGTAKPAEVAPADENGRGLWHPELAYIPVVLAVLLFGLWRYRQLDRRAASGETITNGELRNPIRLLVLSGAAAIAWVYVWPSDGAYGVFHPLASSLLVGVTLVASYLAFRWCRAYDEAMNRRARRIGRLTLWDQVHGWLLWAFTALTAIFGIARYGVDSLSVMAVDMTFVLVFLGVLIGLPLFAAFVGGALRGIWGKVGFALLGLWQALLQFFLPLLLVLAREPWVGLAAGLATAAVSWALSRLIPLALRREDAGERERIGWLLLALWILWNAALCALVFESPTRQQANSLSFAVALLLGAFLSCIWFGGYLAVSICFDGHNNEAGGGSRIESYKQFIRFRLTESSLTGYVIAIDQVEQDGRKLKPRLIDVFELRPRA